MHDRPSTDSYTITNTISFYLTFLLLVFSMRPMPVCPKYFKCTRTLPFYTLPPFKFTAACSNEAMMPTD